MALDDPPPPDNKCKVVIVGAGMAGLSAANHLVKNGVTDFVVLESRNRIGGRIASIDTNGVRLELGANWIHGVLGNPIYEMAVSSGLVNIVNVPKPHKVVASTEEGKQVPFSILQEVYEAYMCFLHRCEEYFLCQYLPPTGVESVGEHIELEIELYLQRIINRDERHLRRAIFDCLLKRETCISGCTSMSEIDLMELGSYTELQGGNIVLPSGYSSILGPVSKPIPEDKILLRHTVAKIYWGGTDCDDDSDEDSSSGDSEKTVTGPQSSPKCLDDSRSPSSGVRVVCENGSQFIADTVICTLPLGVLKQSADVLFMPRLPEHKRESIERLLFGTVDKIFLLYERPFLNPDISEVMLLWDTASDVKGDMDESWYRKIYSFSKLSETVLLGWVSGKEAEHMETLSDQVVADKCTEILRKFLNDPFVPKPKYCIRTHWFNEPNTRGSYTSIAVGASQCDIEAIAQPLYSNADHTKPVVLFAGEHTHCSFYSTVHGAYLTGRSCVQTLLRATEPPPEDLVVECQGTSDLSSWIQGISLDDPA
ncbi:hypothetical protein AAG570_002917 [Ranatra chinensis]|uniref:Amine oxidase domain-containing protein n=1 Tax=Ranatra chinensis TaxID=642074 RepID=A0ABD0YJK6_9HEMI